MVVLLDKQKYYSEMMTPISDKQVADMYAYQLRELAAKVESGEVVMISGNQTAAHDCLESGDDVRYVPTGVYTASFTYRSVAVMQRYRETVVEHSRKQTHVQD